MVEESHESPGDCPRPLRLGLLTLSGDDGRRVLTVAASAGWDAQNVDPSGPVRFSLESLDVVVICTRTIAPDVLVIVTEVSLDPAIPLLVVGRDRDPQHLADVLRSGASDYLLAPFAAEELKVRIGALVARSRGVGERRVMNEVVFDHITRTVVAGPLQMSLSQREWDALNILLLKESSLVTVESLSESLTGAPDNETIVISTISRLRRKIRKHQFFAISIETVYGHGYVARFRRMSDTFSDARKVGL